MSNIPEQQMEAHEAMSDFDLADEIWTAWEQARRVAGGWCSTCGCGNDRMGYAHLPQCQAKTGGVK